MQKNRFKTLLMISSTFAMTLAAAGCYFDAGFGQLLQNVHASPTPVSQEHKEAAELFIQLNEKHNFFAARYKGCHIERNAVLCKSFYKDKSAAEKNKDSRLKAAQLTKLIRQQKWTELSNTSESESVRSIGGLSNKDRQNLTEHILNDKTCISPHLATAMAFKLEEKLPDAKVLSTVRALYARTLECSTDKEFSDLGLYRGGLFEIWQDNPEQATVFLKKLSSLSKDIALTSRAQFWMNHAAREQGKSVSANTMEDHFTSFPLSYHILTDYATMADGPYQTVSDLREQRIQTRSSYEDLNGAIQLVEHFMAQQKDSLAKRTLEFIDYAELTEAEPGFQLYVATLLAKFDDMNHQRFMVLSRLFQNHPQFKTLKNLNIYYPLAFEDLVIKHHRDQDPFLLLSLIRQESSFNPNTKSPVGATGLMQIMPRTAKDMKKRVVTDKELLDPSSNIQLGSRYFAALVREFKNDHMKALASYNAGSGNVRKWMKRYPVDNQLLFVDLIPFDETREYVAGILRNQYWYSKLYPELLVTPQMASQTSAQK
ncbi:putative soluble lytic murein transglycosylase [Bdellovibrio bacteriovorus str. Tiberius]|uniref:Putative soluble lytic murein transglycosylase n=2 Tax=Bdellovibrio bacteriovorus TaxID=959 RepID=K7YZG9_BDEBC|nr:putative soluble lytic murein transglycosylase [Bdellovibrio bacteriovorus str. Tiberius]